MRITQHILDLRVDLLNKTLDRPMAPYTRVDGRLTPNAGNFHLSNQYGGWELCEMVASGGSRDVFQNGHMPKRDLFDRICAMMEGINVS